MTLPQTAKAQPTQNFLDNLAEAHAFFMQQDASTADLRMESLREELREMVKRLRCRRLEKVANLPLHAEGRDCSDGRPD
jgi:hypothetical protein